MGAATSFFSVRLSAGSDHYSVWTPRITFVLIGLFVLCSAFDLDSFTAYALALRDYSMNEFGKSTTIVIGMALVICIAIAASPFGKLRFGKDDDRAEFSNVSWFSMLFGAGLGIGFIFWSIAEPISHAHSNPFTGGIVTDTEGDSTFAIALTMYHWGAMTQASYGIVAIALGLCCYRRGLPFRLSSLLYPVFGKYAFGPLGTVAEVVTLIATVLGLGTSLGLGGQALASSFTADGASTFSGSTSVIVIIGALSFVCVTTPLAKGARTLSLIATGLLLFTALGVLVAGPTATQLQTMVDAGLRYITIFPDLVFLDPAASDLGWQHDWSVSYWGWWIAWAPFVGAFYARISRGRTIRELIVAIMIIPPLGCLVWISIFGGGALGLDPGVLAQLTDATLKAPASAMFKYFEALQIGRFEIVLTCSMIGIIVLLGAQSLNAGITGMSVLISSQTNVRKCDALVWVIGMVGIAIVMTTLGGSELVMTSAWIGGLVFAPVYILIGLGILTTLVSTLRDNLRKGLVPTTPA